MSQEEQDHQWAEANRERNAAEFNLGAAKRKLSDVMVKVDTVCTSLRGCENGRAGLQRWQSLDLDVVVKALEDLAEAEERYARAQAVIASFGRAFG